MPGQCGILTPKMYLKSKKPTNFSPFQLHPKKGGICMKHLRSFFAVLLAAAVCAAVVLFSGCGASVQVQQLTIPGERGSIHATLTTPANAENMPAVVICHGFTGSWTATPSRWPKRWPSTALPASPLTLRAAAKARSRSPLTPPPTCGMISLLPSPT